MVKNLKKLEICEIKPDLFQTSSKPPCMWKRAVRRSTLKKAEADVKTNQGATFNQVVQKSVNFTNQFSGTLPKTAPKPYFLSTHNCLVSKRFTTAPF